jgi:DnaJ-class molecular chaperone
MAVRKIRLQQVEVECAFCKGSGKDPFDLLSSVSTCQVCSGSGQRTLTVPVARCAYCGGNGVHPHSRMVCMTCRGAGQVSVAEDAVKCPGCGGTGKESRHVYTDSVLPCTVCGGKGLVDPMSEAARKKKA